MYLSGLNADLIEWLRGTGRVGGPLQTAGATPVLGESTYAAYLEATTWLTEGTGLQPGDGDRDGPLAPGPEPPQQGDEAQR